MSLARNSAWALFASAGSAPVVLASSVVLARSLDPAAHGQVQAALSLGVLCATVGNAGFVAATIHRLQAAARPAPEAWGTGLLGVTLTGCGLALVGLTMGTFVRERLLLGASSWMLYATVLALLPTLWGAVTSALARGLDRFAVWASWEWASKAGRLTLWGALWGLGWMSPEAVLLSVVLVEALAAALAAAQLREVGRPHTSSNELRAAGRFGLPAAATTLGGQLHERVDLFLLALLRGDPVEVAMYAVAVAVVNRLRVVPLAMASALFPRVAAVSPRDGAWLAARVCRLSLAMSTALGLAVLSVAPWAMPWLFGAAYGATVPLMWLLVPATVAYGVYLVLARWFQGVQRQRVNVGALGVGGVVNVALNLVWIPEHGAAGAAAASLVSYTLQAAVVWVAFLRLGHISAAASLLARPSDLAALRR